MLNTGDCSDVGSSSTDTSDSKFSIENNEASTVLIIAVVVLAIGLFVTIIVIFALIRKLKRVNK